MLIVFFHLFTQHGLKLHECLVFDMTYEHRCFPAEHHVSCNYPLLKRHAVRTFFYIKINLNGNDCCTNILWFSTILDDDSVLLQLALRQQPALLPVTHSTLFLNYVQRKYSCKTLSLTLKTCVGLLFPAQIIVQDSVRKSITNWPN